MPEIDSSLTQFFWLVLHQLPLLSVLCLSYLIVMVYKNKDSLPYSEHHIVFITKVLMPNCKDCRGKSSVYWINTSVFFLNFPFFVNVAAILIVTQAENYTVALWASVSSMPFIHVISLYHIKYSSWYQGCP